MKKKSLESSQALKHFSPPLQMSCFSINYRFLNYPTPPGYQCGLQHRVSIRVSTNSIETLGLCFNWLTLPAMVHRTESQEMGCYCGSYQPQILPRPQAPLGMTFPTFKSRGLWIRSIVSSIVSHGRYSYQRWNPIFKTKGQWNTFDWIRG